MPKSESKTEQHPAALISFAGHNAIGCAVKMDNSIGMDPSDSEETPLSLITIHSDDYPDADIQRFPPLLTPGKAQLRESIGGSFVVLTIIAFFIGITHMITLRRGHHLPYYAPAAVLFVLYSLAVAAITLLVGIMRSDGGAIPRTPKNCYPLPLEVAERLRAGLSMDGLPNVQDGGRTFCIRCLVWRGKGAHHCSTCQRCVPLFDHHCGVFGRCIAGEVCACIQKTDRGLKFVMPLGNMWQFVLIICVGGVASLVSYGFMFLSLIYYK